MASATAAGGRMRPTTPRKRLAILRALQAGDLTWAEIAAELHVSRDVILLVSRDLRPRPAPPNGEPTT